MTEAEVTLADRLVLLGRALDRLDEVLLRDPVADDAMRDATIQRFEFCAELSWRTMADALRVRGIEARSPRGALQGAYREEWIAEEKVWIDMMTDRNRTSHTYREDIALQVLARIPAYRDAMRDAWARLNAP